MADLTALPAILERLKAATGPDREIDAAITVALCSPIRLSDETVHLRIPRKDDDCASGTYWYVARSGMSLRTSESITGSLDAIRALTERLLPGTYMRVEPRFYIDPPGVKWLATIIRPLWDRWTPFEDWFENIEGEQHADQCLACCIALVTARIAMEAKYGR